MDMSASGLTGRRIEIRCGSREEPLPAEVLRRVLVLSSECMGQLDHPKAGAQVSRVEVAESAQVVHQAQLRDLGQHRAAGLAALAGSHRDDKALEVDVLDPELQAFH